VSTCTITFCCEADLPELFGCFAEWYVFNPRLREREFFDWQFRDTPLRLGDGEYDFLLLRNREDRITGCLGFVGFEFHSGDRIQVGGWTHNWQADGQGDGGLALLGRFMQLVDNRFFLRLNDVSGGIIKLLQVPFLAAIPRWWAAIQPEIAIELFAIRSEADRAMLHRSAAKFLAITGTAVSQAVTRLQAEEEFLFGKFGAIGYVRRTGRYLNWRYLDIPKHDYRIIRTEEAIGVYRIETIMGTDASVIRVLEWSFDAAQAAGAIATIMEQANSRNPILIDFHSTCRPIGKLLEQFGFLPQSATECPMPDLFRPTHHSGGYAVGIDLPPHRRRRSIDFDRWYITIGDSDIDRVKL
jgi:hypothetical protein